ncbi:hypothetical protein [Actinomadura napierensis]|uniref:hypothetical protein n=1 Tax=Actinomadura napierensis TaxID=267854 RepID=UPI0031D81C0A
MATATVSAWPTASVASNSIVSDIKSGKCKKISGIADTACMTMNVGLVNVYVARGNIDVVSTFRLLGLVENNSKSLEYARQYAETISQSIH